MSAIRNAPQKFSRERNTNIQRTLHVRFMWSRKLVPTKPLGQAHPKNKYAIEPTTAGKRNTKSISM